MRQLINFLGFTDITSILWSILVYTGMVLIIIAVVSDKLRNYFFVFGPLALLVYSWLYLRNPVLAGLQFIMIISGGLNLSGDLFNAKEHAKKMTPVILGIVTGFVYSNLLFNGHISEFWPLIGSFGLLGIAFGVTQAPRKIGFILMAIGGVLIIVYAFALSIWIWVILNIIFTIASIVRLRSLQVPEIRKINKAAA